MQPGWPGLSLGAPSPQRGHAAIGAWSRAGGPGQPPGWGQDGGRTGAGRQQHLPVWVRPCVLEVVTFSCHFYRQPSLLFLVLIIFWRLAANDSSPLPHQPPPLPSLSPAQPLQPTCPAPCPSTGSSTPQHPSGTRHPPMPTPRCWDTGKPQSRAQGHPSWKSLSHGRLALAALPLNSGPGTHPPRVQTRTSRPPSHTTGMQAHGQKSRHAWLCPRPGPEPGARPPEPSPAGTRAPSPVQRHGTPTPPGTCPGLHPGASPGLGLPTWDPPACCAWMSLPYTASADSISVRLVWIIWGEGQREELGSPPAPRTPPSRAEEAKRLGQGLPLAPARWLRSGPPRLAAHSQVRCDQRLAGGQVSLQHKGRKQLRLWLLMGFLPPGGTAGRPASRPWHRVQAARAGGRGCGVPGLVPSWASLRLDKTPPWGALHTAPRQRLPAVGWVQRARGPPPWAGRWSRYHWPHSSSP